MKIVVKLLSIILALFLLCIIVPTVLYIPKAVLNYKGFCIDQNRYLSNNEKIEGAINFVNRQSVVKIQDKNNSKLYKYLQYRSVDDFKKNNPNCCQIKMPDSINDEKKPWTFFWYRLGGYAGVITLKYKARYLDDNSSEKFDIKMKELEVSNCGNID